MAVRVRFPFRAHAHEALFSNARGGLLLFLRTQNAVHQRQDGRSVVGRTMARPCPQRRGIGWECSADGGRCEGVKEENATRVADAPRRVPTSRTCHAAKTTPPRVGTQRRYGEKERGKTVKIPRQVFDSDMAFRRSRHAVFMVAARGKCKRPVLCWPSQHGAFVICQLDFCRWNGLFFVFKHWFSVLFHLPFRTRRFGSF